MAEPFVDRQFRRSNEKLVDVVNDVKSELKRKLKEADSLLQEMSDMANDCLDMGDRFDVEAKRDIRQWNVEAMEKLENASNSLDEFLDDVNSAHTSSGNCVEYFD